MSKSSTATAPKIPTQLSSKSAWSKGPPQTSSAPSPRSQSPAPNQSAPQPTHSRRPSALGQGVSFKDGVARTPSSAAKSGSSVTFGSIDDVSAPISSSPASVPPIKSEGVKSFGTLPATPTSAPANGKLPAPSSASTSSSHPPHPKFDVKKLFQIPSSAPPVSTAPSQSSAADVTSPSNRPSALPQLSPQQPPSLGPHMYTPFVPSGGLRPQQNGAQPTSGGPPRSPVYPRQMPNGQMNGVNGRPNGAQVNPGGAGPMPTGMSSPRMGPPMAGQPTGMPQPMPMQGWYYQYQYPPFTGMPPEAYIPYPPQAWAMPQQMMPQPHQPPQSMPGPPPQTGMPLSPRNPQPPLHPPGTPTLAPAMPNTGHPPHGTPSPHTHTSALSNVSSPPPTPSTSTSGSGLNRLNTQAAAFMPRQSKIRITTADGAQVNLENLKQGVATPTQAAPASPVPPRKQTLVRLEAPEAREKRLAEEMEKERLKKEKEEKAKAKLEEEERAKKAKEEEETKARRAREEEERKKAEEEERIRKQKEEEEEARLKKEEEEKRVRQEEEEREKEKERARKEEEEERIRKEEEERATKEAEEAKAKAAEVAEEAKPAVEEPSKAEPEEGELEEQKQERELPKPTEKPESIAEEPEEEAKEKVQDKGPLRIDTAVSIPEPKKRPGPLDLSSAKSQPITPGLPSALATARIIEDISSVSYPEGIKSPKVELNQNAKQGKFRYDRDFLMQFMAICKEKPDSLPPLDAIGLEPSDQSFPMSRGGSQRRQSSAAMGPPSSTARTGLGISTFKTGPSMFNMGQFAAPPAKMSSEERFAMSNPSRTASMSSGPQGMQFGRPAPMVRSSSQGGAGAMSSKRTRSKRGTDRGEPSRGGPSGSAFGSYGMQPGGPLEPVAPLEVSANRWQPASIVKKPQQVDIDSPEVVDRKVRALLNKLTMERFESISDQIIEWANKSENETDGKTLIQVIRLVFEKATDEATWSEMYARLCRKMMEQISPKVQDEGIKTADGKPIAGGHLFRKYLLNRCQEDFERGWVAKEATAAAAATKATEDQAAKAAAGKDTGEDVLYSEEYYAAQKAKRQGLGLIKFIGELFKLQMLTERIMHECVKKLLGNVENPEEEEIESLCKLLTTVGKLLDTPKAHAHMDVYFARMKELCKNPNVNSRMQFMLQDVIELRARNWVPRNLVAAPTTIAAVHELAAKEKEREAQRSTSQSMSRGGSRRGGEREHPQVGPDGWSVAGTQKQSNKAGDLSHFGKISKTPASMVLGPSSIFQKDKSKSRESTISRASSSNMFSKLMENPELANETVSSKSSRPPSRKSSIDLGPGGVPEPAPQRRKLQLLPRSKPLADETKSTATPAESEAGGSDEESVEESVSLMSEAEAKTRVKEDSKEFFSIRDLNEAEVYFTKLPSEHRFRLVDKLVSSALESKEADAQLVADFFSRALSKNLCSPQAFEDGFAPAAEILDDIAIDAPKAFNLMAIMMKGAGLDKDEERRTRLASKSMDSDKLLGLLS